MNLKMIPPKKSNEEINWESLINSERERCDKMKVEFKPFTSSQRKFALWLFNSSQDVSRIGDMARVFEVVTRFIKYNPSYNKQLK